LTSPDELALLAAANAKCQGESDRLLAREHSAHERLKQLKAELVLRNLDVPAI
jgi:hypothetical protein